MPTMCEAPDWPGHRNIWTWFWEGATTIYSSISLPFYCGFQSSSYRALLGCWRHSFTATVYLWFQRVVIQKQSHRKLPILFLKSSTLKAFIWHTGCHGAKNEGEKNTTSLSDPPSNERGKRKSEKRIKTNWKSLASEVASRHTTQTSFKKEIK